MTWIFYIHIGSSYPIDAPIKFCFDWHCSFRVCLNIILINMYMADNDTPGVWPIGFIKRSTVHCYTSEPCVFFMFFPLKDYGS